MDAVPTVAAMAERLDSAGYLPDEGVATAAYLALVMGRPLFLEGEAGVGKTALAHALAEVAATPLLRLQCYEGIDAAQALYDWDFPRQLLHLRAVQISGEAGGRISGGAGGDTDAGRLEGELYGRRFLLPRPLLQAVESSRPGAPSVLLVDEIDRADDEFEAFLLEVLSDFTVTVPELGTIRAAAPPLMVITSNRTREVHDALKRRCLYHWLEHPSYEREVAILRRRLPGAGDGLTAAVARTVAVLRGAGLQKPPGVAETLDWTSAMLALGARDLEPGVAAASLGALLKYREDQEQVLSAAGAGGGLAALVTAQAGA